MYVVWVYTHVFTCLSTCEGVKMMLGASLGRSPLYMLRHSPSQNLWLSDSARPVKGGLLGGYSVSPFSLGSHSTVHPSREVKVAGARGRGSRQAHSYHGVGQVFPYHVRQAILHRLASGQPNLESLSSSFSLQVIRSVAGWQGCPSPMEPSPLWL